MVKSGVDAALRSAFPDIAASYHIFPGPATAPWTPIPQFGAGYLLSQTLFTDLLFAPVVSLYTLPAYVQQIILLGAPVLLPLFCLGWIVPPVWSSAAGRPIQQGCAARLLYLARILSVAWTLIFLVWFFLVVYVAPS